jgi:uncharacterized membrane protein YdbT with pleckstrin-like domain
VAFSEKLLHEGEELVLVLRPHWLALAPRGLAATAAIALGVAALGVDAVALRWGAAALVVVALVAFGARYARWATTTFAVTTERVVFHRGVVSRRGSQVLLEKVNSVDFHQSLFERLIGSGHLVIESGSEAGVETFSGIPKPLAVQQEINRQIDLHDRQRWDRTPTSPSIPDQIERLAELAERGIITATEFAAKKTELLGRL